MRSGHDTTAADLGGTLPAPPAWSKPTTRRKAARRRTGYARLIRARIVTLLTEMPSGLSAHEIAARLSLPIKTVAPRMSELRRGGMIKASGKRTKNKSGFTAHIWELWLAGAPYVDAASIFADEIAMSERAFGAMDRGVFGGTL